MWRDIFSFNQLRRDRWVSAVVKNKAPLGSRVLDLASGTCPYRHLFAHCEYKTHDFMCLNPDQNRGNLPYGKIDYISDITNVPVADGSFDVILCTEALEHVPRPEAVIREIARLLKGGGSVILTAPLGSGLHQEPFHYYGGFTPYWYRLVLGEYGFRDIQIEANGGTFKHIGQECLRFMRMTAPWRMQAPWWAKVVVAPFWIALMPMLGVFMPLFCHWLDRFDDHRAFTVGYHVLATKA